MRAAQHLAAGYLPNSYAIYQLPVINVWAQMSLVRDGFSMPAPREPI
jgi:hypothetical protein